MRNLKNVGRALLVMGALAVSACGSSSSGAGTGGSSGGTGGVTGSGGALDAAVGTGGVAGVDAGGTGGVTGAGGAADAGTGVGGANAHQDHLNIINKTTTGGVPVTRAAPAIAYDSCKI